MKRRRCQHPLFLLSYSLLSSHRNHGLLFLFLPCSLSTLIAFLCQSFLLHRTLVFLSTLVLISPPNAHSSLAKRIVFSKTGRDIYATVMGLAISLALATGVMTGWALIRSGSLVGLGEDDQQSRM